MFANSTDQKPDKSNAHSTDLQTKRNIRLVLIGLTVVVLGIYFGLRSQGIISDSSRAYSLIVFLPPLVYLVAAWLHSRSIHAVNRQVREYIQSALFTLMLAVIVMLSINWSIFSYLLIVVFGISVLLLTLTFRNR